MSEPRTASPQPTSTILQDLLLQAPEDGVSLGWLMRGLGGRSFGIVLLLSGLLASLPGVSLVAAIPIMIPAYQMVLARRAPVLPRAISGRTFRKQRLVLLLGRAIPILRRLERFIRPRWQMPPAVTKRVVGGAVLLLSLLLFAPIPLSNVPPALVIILLALGYLEEDGLLLCIALAAALFLLMLGAGAAWQALNAAIWMAGLL